MSALPGTADARREHLRRRCAEQRRQLGEAVGGVAERLQGIDRGVLMLRKFRLAPALLAAGAAALATLPMFRYVRGALMVVRTLRGLLPSR